jgi:hypothetical protein
MNNGEISVERLSDEQNADVNNQEMKNSAPDQTNSEETTHVINVVKASPMNPKLMYIFFFSLIHHKINNILIREYSCWSRYPTVTAVGVFSVFTSLVMVVGVLTVWFTTKETSMFFVFRNIQIISLESLKF